MSELTWVHVNWMLEESDVTVRLCGAAGTSKGIAVAGSDAVPTPAAVTAETKNS